jgi:hypothetical protein
MAAMTISPKSASPGGRVSQREQRSRLHASGCNGHYLRLSVENQRACAAKARVAILAARWTCKTDSHTRTNPLLNGRTRL